ncbi:MAG: histidine kinase dimerization/phospho-acceptor domain-containing protein, partial [Candidatus Dormibacteria bacterium]
MSTRVGNAVDAGKRWATTVPTQVAVRSTAAVAAVYLVLSVVVVLIVGHNLSANVDQRLASGVTSVQTYGSLRRQPPQGVPGFGDLLGGRYGTPLFAWVFGPDGTAQTLLSTRNNPDLPESARHVNGLETVNIGGADLRVMGAPIPLQSPLGGPVVQGWVVVGQATTGIAQARDTLLLAEVVVFPILVLLVFFGALAVGRRVAAPLERARLRQLEFTADASHELRTPLSVIEAEASLALSRPREPEAYQASFVRVDTESKKLRRLVDDLLWLAR